MRRGGHNDRCLDLEKAAIQKELAHDLQSMTAGGEPRSQWTARSSSPGAGCRADAGQARFFL